MENEKFDLKIAGIVELPTLLRLRNKKLSSRIRWSSLGLARLVTLLQRLWLDGLVWGWPTPEDFSTRIQAQSWQSVRAPVQAEYGDDNALPVLACQVWLSTAC